MSQTAPLTPPAAVPGTRFGGSWEANRRRVLANATRIGGTLLLIGLIAYFSAVRPDAFPTWANAKAILQSASILLILGCGLTVVLAIGEFDLSFSATIGLSGATAVLSMVNLGWPMWLSILAAIGVGVIVGIVNGVAVAYGRAPAFIITLAVGSTATGLEVLLSGNNVVPGLPQPFINLTQGTALGVPNAVWISLVGVVVIYVLLEYTTFGRRLRAIGSNRRSAELSGLPVGRERVLAFVIVGALAGVAGVMLMSEASQYYPDAGASYLLSPYTAAFLGAAAVGMGRFGALSTLFGVLFIGILQTGLTMLGQPSWLVEVIEGAVLAFAVLLARQVR
jgi:ribose transport system permease protein